MNSSYHLRRKSVNRSVSPGQDEMELMNWSSAGYQPCHVLHCADPWYRRLEQGALGVVTQCPLLSPSYRLVRGGTGEASAPSKDRTGRNTELSSFSAGFSLRDSPVGTTIRRTWNGGHETRRDVMSYLPKRRGNGSGYKWNMAFSGGEVSLHIMACLGILALHL